MADIKNFCSALIDAGLTIKTVKTPLKMLVLGRARNGKSHYALLFADRMGSYPLYLANAEIKDNEMTRCIEKHKK